MKIKRSFLLFFTISLTLITIAFGLFISIKTTFFRWPMSSIAPVIWSIFILLIIIVILLMMIQIALKVTELRDEKIGEHSDMVKITLQLDGAPFIVETSNKDRVEEILQLIQDRQARRPSGMKDGARASGHSDSVSPGKLEAEEIDPGPF